MAVKRPMLPKKPKAIAEEIAPKETPALTQDPPVAEAPPVEETPVIQVEKTAQGFKLAGVVIPFNYSPASDVDPMAEEILGNMFSDPMIDANIVGFHQFTEELETNHGTVYVAKSGVYLIEITHGESDSYYVQFVKIFGIGLVYAGKWESTNVNSERTLDLSPNVEERQKELDLIQKTFEWSH